jgi:hypothetical protein
MKISTASDTVIERTGIASDNTFRINFNSKMAKILSDGIYSNKPQAICRELGCNALDSHVMAGKGTVPIEIHLPTELEPFFHVRDFGLGLDHDEVLNIFTVYGESTKTATNDAVGQLGLGSKVPFAYCDAFDVVARKHGVERHYSMYKNETGLPCCALLWETPTDQCNGVTVKLAVPRGDFAVFADNARNVFRWFDVQPTFTGVSNLRMPDTAYEFQGQGWGVLGQASRDYGSSHRSYALMGPVAYPIDLRNIKGDAIRKVGLESLMRLPLVLKFNIGDLDMAVSREALSYDPRTQKAILDRLMRVQQELGEQIGTRISGAATQWAAHAAWHDTFNTGEYRYDLSTIFGNSGIRWQHTLVKSSEMHVAIRDLYGDSGNASQRIGVMRLYTASRRTREEQYHEEIRLPTSKNTVIVFNDLDKGASSRILKLAQDNRNNINVFCFAPSAVKSWTEMQEIFHGAEVVMASSLPRSSQSRTKTVTLRYAPTGAKRDGVAAWTTTTVDLDQGGYYVRLNRWDVTELDTAEHRSLGEITELVRELGIKLETPIYAARDAAMKKAMTDNADWVNVLDYLRQQVSTQLTPQACKMIASREDYARVRGMFYDESLWKADYNVTAHSPWGRFIQDVRQLQKDAQAGGRLAVWTRLAALLGMKVENAQCTSQIADQARALAVLYPMHTAVTTSRWINKEVVAQLTEYVNSMDQLRTLREQALQVQA